MADPYKACLYELRKWIDIVAADMQSRRFYNSSDAQRVRQWIGVVATGVQDEYPFYASFLPKIGERLFCTNQFGANVLNPAGFGQLTVIVGHIVAEPVVVPFWPAIHTRITRVSCELYKDGHYASAAESAIKEVEVRLRERFAELKPGVTMPSGIGDIIGALLSENGIFKFCDTSTVSGRDYRRGVRMLVQGAMAAYRNPSAHANLRYNKREAMEQIMLASQLMFVLDKQIE